MWPLRRFSTLVTRFSPLLQNRTAFGLSHGNTAVVLSPRRQRKCTKVAKNRLLRRRPTQCSVIVRCSTVNRMNVFRRVLFGFLPFVSPSVSLFLSRKDDRSIIEEEELCQLIRLMWSRIAWFWQQTHMIRQGGKGKEQGKGLGDTENSFWIYKEYCVPS
jgi:hypothetical protein